MQSIRSRSVSATEQVLAETRDMRRIYEFITLVWRENMAGARITVRDAWTLAGYLSS
jgi:hypothetical protein